MPHQDDIRAGATVTGRPAVARPRRPGARLPAGPVQCRRHRE